MSAFDGKKVFVTGGTGGIGMAVTRAFLEKGAKVFIQGRDEKKMEGNPGIALEFDAQNKFVLAADAAQKFLGKIDILVCSIGSGRFKKTGLLTENEWRDIFGQNFFSATQLIKEVLPYMEGKDPNIVVIGSIAGIERVGAPVGYAVSKAALHAYVKSVVTEFADKNIRINIVHPGNIFFQGGRWDEIRNADPEDVDNYINKSVPQKRFGRPEEIANAVLYLASEDAGFVTGASVVIDGGQTVSF
jgi:3-oxoacyl-[acyl-carrier protein] reductase